MADSSLSEARSMAKDIARERDFYYGERVFYKLISWFQTGAMKSWSRHQKMGERFLVILVESEMCQNWCHEYPGHGTRKWERDCLAEMKGFVIRVGFKC